MPTLGQTARQRHNILNLSVRSSICSSVFSFFVGHEVKGQSHTRHQAEDLEAWQSSTCFGDLVFQLTSDDTDSVLFVIPKCSCTGNLFLD